MTKKIIVDASYDDEVRLALIEGEEVIDFEHHISDEENIKGNIYVGVIERIEQSLQAVFVNYGGLRSGFLPFTEIHPNYLTAVDNEAAKEVNDNAANTNYEGDLILSAAGYDKAKREVSDESVIAGEVASTPVAFACGGIVKGQKILVQITRDSRGSKGCMLTTYIAFRGKYCVFLPYNSGAVFISDRLESKSEIKRLSDIGAKLLSEHYSKGGVRLLQESEYKTIREIRTDLRYMIYMWERIRANALKKRDISFIHAEGNIVVSSIRDMYNSSVGEIVIAGSREFDRAYKFMEMIFPRYINKLSKFDGYDIFQKYGIERDTESIYKPRVNLKSGGYIVINKTEALIAIDVNSGKSLAGHNIGETAINTNIEAASEICKQMRLRGWGGIIVIDFIDMYSAQDRRKIIDIMNEEAKKDSSNLRIGELSEFCLLTMTRQRTKRNIDEKTIIVCPHCNGEGNIKSVIYRANKLLLAISRIPERSEVTVFGDAEFVMYVLNRRRRPLFELEQRLELKISINIENSVSYRDFELKHKRVGAEKESIFNLEELSHDHNKSDHMSKKGAASIKKVVTEKSGDGEGHVGARMHGQQMHKENTKYSAQDVKKNDGKHSDERSLHKRKRKRRKKIVHIDEKRNNSDSLLKKVLKKLWS